MDIEHFCKILNTTGNACGLDKDIIHAEITKRAIEASPGDESVAQAYTRFVTSTAAGREMLKAYRTAPVAAKPLQAPQEVEYKRPNAADLDKEAREIADRDGVSLMQARLRAHTAALRRERDAATRDVKDQRKPIADAERELERAWSVGRSPGSARV
jgi:hypothetical protein